MFLCVSGCKQNTQAIKFSQKRIDNYNQLKRSDSQAKNQSVKTDVFDCIKEFMINQENETRNFGADFKKYERDLRTAFENLEKVFSYFSKNFSLNPKFFEKLEQGKIYKILQTRRRCFSFI